MPGTYCEVILHSPSCRFQSWVPPVPSPWTPASFVAARTPHPAQQTFFCLHTQATRKLVAASEEATIVSISKRLLQLPRGASPVANYEYRANCKHQKANPQMMHCVYRLETLGKLDSEALNTLQHIMKHLSEINWTVWRIQSMVSKCNYTNIYHFKHPFHIELRKAWGWFSKDFEPTQFSEVMPPTVIEYWLASWSSVDIADWNRPRVESLKQAKKNDELEHWMLNHVDWIYTHVNNCKHNQTIRL